MTGWVFEDADTPDIYSAPGHIGDALFDRMKQGDEFYRQGDYQKALDEYKSLLKLKDENGWLYYRKAHALHKLGRYGEAIDAY